MTEQISNQDVLEACIKYDDFIGLRFDEECDINRIKENLVKTIQSGKLLTKDIVDNYNRVSIYMGIDKRNIENTDTQLMYKAIKVGKTQHYFIHHGQNNDAFKKLIVGAIVKLNQ